MDRRATPLALALYALSLGVIGIVVGVSGAGVEADFERGHTVVSALWALVGLAGLVYGLARARRSSGSRGSGSSVCASRRSSCTTSRG